MALFNRKKKAEPAPAPVAPKNEYEFIAKCNNEMSAKALTKYQKFWTDPEDKYDGMKLKEFKADGYPGDKVYEYPPIAVDVELKESTEADGSVTIGVYILDGPDDEIYVGTAAKTKAKKIQKILHENGPRISGELYGGKYWKMEDSGYVDDRWSEDLTVRVTLDW